MRALVSGASGHVGAFVVRHLLAGGAHVEVLVRPSSDLWRLSDPLLGDVSSQVEVRRVEFSDAAALNAEVNAAKPDAVFHLAWGGITAKERDAASQITTNVANTLALLEAAHHAGCSTFVGVGSQAEYGERGKDDVDFGRLLNRGEVSGFSAYGLAKVCAGLLVLGFCQKSEMRGVWLRLFATYGPQDDGRHLLPFVIEELLANRKPALSPGDQKWDYLWIEDAAKAIVAAANATQAKGAFDLGSGAAPTVRALVEQTRDLVDPSLALGLGELPQRPEQLMLLQADLTELQKQIEWAPQTPLELGLAQTIAWHRARKESSL